MSFDVGDVRSITFQINKLTKSLARRKADV